MIIRSVVPGIARLLQNSPELNKLSVYTIKECNTVLVSLPWTSFDTFWYITKYTACKQPKRSMSFCLSSVLQDKLVSRYLDSQDLNPDQCWRLKDVVFPTSYKYEVVKPKLMASFMELLLANTSTLETLVLRLGSYINRSRFEELFQIALRLSHNYKVSIVLKWSGGWWSHSLREVPLKLVGKLLQLHRFFLAMYLGI